MERSSLRDLGRQPGYPSFYAAATVTRLADDMFAVGTVLLMLDRTGSAALAGATVAAVTLPSLVTGPVLGAWLDRSRSRKTVMVIDQVLAATTLIALVLLAGNAPNWIIPLVALGAGITWPLSFGGFTSLIPVIVPEGMLPRANALEATSFNVAIIAGPALAGTISALASPAASLLVEAVLTLAAIALIVRLPTLEVEPHRMSRSLREIVRAGLLHLVRTPPLRSVTVTGAINLGGLGLLTVAFPFFAVDLGADRSAAGFLWASFAFGSTLGALTLVRLQMGRRPHLVVLRAIGTMGLIMLTWPLAPSLTIALMLIALAGVADGPGFAATFAVRQRWTPLELHGQIFTTAASLKVGSYALGAALAGPAVVALGARGTLVLAACVQFAAVAIGWLAGTWTEADRRRATTPVLDLEQDDDVEHEHERERDRPPVQVALDQRAPAEGAAAGAADAERAREARVLARMEQNQEDQDDRQENLDDLEQHLHRRSILDDRPARPAPRRTPI
jgi:MFS family permease